MNIFLLKVSKNFWLFCVIISLVILMKLILFNWLALNKGAIDFHQPISYIRQPINMSQSGLIQEYQFNNKIKAKYNVAIKIIKPDFEYLGKLLFDGEYKISVLDGRGYLVNEFFTTSSLKKNWFKIYLSSDIGGEYYILNDELFLKELSYYKVRVENLKGLSMMHKSIKFELIVSPLKYNEKIQKRNLLTKLIIWISILIFSSTLSANFGQRRARHAEP